MDHYLSYDAILFPADGRQPHIISLTTTQTTHTCPETGQIMYSNLPHPEIHMDSIAEGAGTRAWGYQVCTPEPWASTLLIVAVVDRMFGRDDDNLCESIHYVLPHAISSRCSFSYQ